MKIRLKHTPTPRNAAGWSVGVRLALACGLVWAAQAQTIKTWNVPNGNFFDAANWTPAGAPAATEIGLINNGGTATISADAGTRELGCLRLGDIQNGTVSGHVIMNGGTLKVGANPGDPKALIGLSAVPSSFIMNGGTILFDGPDLPGLIHGVNELDWEVGEKGMGRFEMHNDAVFRAGDDLKIAENAAGNGYCLIDGNARVSVGSGISVSNGGSVEQTMIVGGHALVEAGNSLGAGNPNGYTDEGYLTLSIGGGRAKLVLQENAVMNIRVLSSRVGTTRMTVKDDAQFHIFDVLAGRGFIDNQTPPDRPEIVGGFNSTLSSEAPSDSILTLQDRAQATVNASAGLGISAPRAAGSATGGKGLLIVRDQASLRIEQYLALGTGTQAATSDGTLEVIGPDAKVSIGGNLNLAVDPDGNIPTTDLQDASGNPKPAKGALSVVITGPAQATVNVGGSARIAQGILRVRTDGYVPSAGTTYTVLKAAGTPALDGQFRIVDLGNAAAPAGHTWAVEYTADSVILKVVPGPGRPDDNGLTAATGTVVVNPANTINHGNTESLGVAVTRDGHAVVGWEDDSDTSGPEPLKYIAAAWTLYDGQGNSITPVKSITSLAFPGQTLDSKFLSYFRNDGSPTPAFTGWGPKIKANLFGDGFGMGANTDNAEVDLGMEVVEWGAYNDDGGFPGVQLLSATGEPQGIVAGVAADYSTRTPQAIRIGDWDYLANGNLVIVGESRQSDDLVDLYGGGAAGNHAIYRIVTPAGAEVRPVGLVSETATPNGIWHGVGVTRNGFGVRFEASGRATVRLFGNAGNPTSGNIDLATLAGDPAAAGGGRGDGAGFHGNGNDAYVAVNGSGSQVRVTVLNADGTLRYSTSAIDDVTLKSVDRLDAAISPTGEVLVVFTATYEGGPLDYSQDPPRDVQAVLGRLLGPTGNPRGGTFRVSEIEPIAGSLGARRPRVAWRNSTAAVTWQTRDGNVMITDDTGQLVTVEAVALRLFTVRTAAPLRITGIAASSLSATITWTGGTAPYLLQMKAALADAEWVNVLTTSDTSATVPNLGSTAFFRVQDQAGRRVIPFAANLTAAAEQAGVNSPGTGRALLALDGDRLWYHVRYRDLTGPASAAHIHAGAATGSGSPFLSLAGPFGATGAVTGSATLTADRITAIKNGQTYVNFHTAAFGGGEIRGQVVPLQLRATLSGAAERPTPVTTTGTGIAILDLVGDQLAYTLTYSGLTGDATAAHIHLPAGPEGTASPVVFLPAVSGKSGAVSGTASLKPNELDAIVTGQAYFNIHTSFKAGGEIRGQVVPQD